MSEHRSDEVKGYINHRDEIMSSSPNDKHLISQKSHKEIKDVSLPSLHNITRIPTNGQNKDLITNDPSENSELLDKNTDKMTKSHRQLNEDTLSDPFKKSPESHLKNDPNIYSDTRTLVDKVPHRYSPNMATKLNEDISLSSNNESDHMERKSQSEKYNSPLQQNLSEEQVAILLMFFIIWLFNQQH